MVSNYQNYFRTRYGWTSVEQGIAYYRRWFLPQWKFLHRKIRVHPGDRILEVGSGIGALYSFLPKNIEYTGIELDREAVILANEYFGVQKFFAQPFETFDETEQFHTIFAFEVLEHLHDPLAAIKKISRLLRPNGVFCGTSPYPSSSNVTEDSTHFFVLHPKNWERFFMQSGFRSVELYPMTFPKGVWKIYNMRIPFYIPSKFFISTCLIIAKK